MRRIALALVPLALLAAGCTSTPSRIDTPQPAQVANAQTSGPTKVQYAAGTQPQPANPDRSMNSATGTSGAAGETGYRNTTTPAIPKMTLTSSQDRALRSQRPEVNLYEDYNRGLPWNSGTSPLGYRTPISSGTLDRGRR